MLADFDFDKAKPPDIAIHRQGVAEPIVNPVIDETSEPLAADERQHQRIGEPEACKPRELVELGVVFGNGQFVVKMIDQELLDRFESTEVENPVVGAKAIRGKRELEAQGVAVKKAAMRMRRAVLAKTRRQSKRVVICFGHKIHKDSPSWGRQVAPSSPR